MAHFEKDFVMRQVNDMTKALGQFMDKDAIDDMLSIDAKEIDIFTNSNHKDQLDSKIEDEIERFKKEERNTMPTDTSNNEPKE